MRQSIRFLLISAGLGLCSLPATAQLFDKMAGVESKSEPSADKAPMAAIKPIAKPDAANKQVVPEPVFDLSAYIDNTGSLAGNFEQIVYSNGGESVSGGTFKLKRPGMFDWKYTRPNAQRIISNGSKVYHYDEDLEQVTIRPRSELAGDVAMNLLVGDKKLTQAFNVSQQPAAKAPPRLRSNDPGLLFYRLTPKQSGDDIDQVWLVINQGKIAAVYVDTGVGQQSLIVLRDVQRNKVMSTKDFTFTPPAGVDVIGG